MNWEVGQVLDALRAHSIEKDTLVFFTSDHGAGKTPLLFGPFSDYPPPPRWFLPRQARDKREEKHSKKEAFFRRPAH
jgi:arylsulfatase A-like enzyme